MTLNAKNANEVTTNNEFAENITMSKSSAYWYVKQDCFAATSESAFNELTKACNRNDLDTVQYLMLRGTVVVLTKGTSVQMVKHGFTKSIIKVTSGKYKGVSFYIDTEFLGSN